MKFYYEFHESVYQQLKTNGSIGWGGKKSIEELGDPRTLNYLKRCIPDFFTPGENQEALDLGCGTGTTAFLLAQMGFNVTGIDISPTAIEMAKELSKRQNLAIRFEVEDFLQIKSLKQKYDLIYDSHFLHCIVFEQDRQKFFVNIKDLLKSDGIFILDTMVMSKTFSPAGQNSQLRFDEDFILWHKTNRGTGHGIVEDNDQSWCAQRRIYPQEKILEEIDQAGFQILANELDLQEENEPYMLRLVLKPKDAE